jgi:hypothetical protein
MHPNRHHRSHVRLNTTTSPRSPKPRRHPPGGATHRLNILTANDAYILMESDRQHPVAARDQYAELLPVRARVSGPEHPDTLTTRANLATWTGEAGDPVAARDQYAELLPVRARVSGPEHPDTLTTRANLAHWAEQADLA